MKERYRKLDGKRVPVSELPLAIIYRDLARGPRVKPGRSFTAADIRLRLEVELIARSYGWPTKRN